MNSRCCETSIHYGALPPRPSFLPAKFLLTLTIHFSNFGPLRVNRATSGAERAQTTPLLIVVSAIGTHKSAPPSREFSANIF